MITTTDILNTVIVTTSIAACAYCIWNGRKVMKIWIEKEDIAWEKDEDNPANWYLKDPNKFREVT